MSSNEASPSTPVFGDDEFIWNIHNENISQSSEYHQLIYGEILSSPQYATRLEPNDDGWGNNEEENALLNIHMDVYEGWGCDYNEVNDLF